MEDNKNIQGEELSDELNEEQLDAVAGGGPTWNRYDPKTCKNMKRTKYECVGLLSKNWCDHYRMTTHYYDIAPHNTLYKMSCAKGAYPEYIGDVAGNPK